MYALAAQYVIQLCLDIRSYVARYVSSNSYIFFVLSLAKMLTKRFCFDFYFSILYFLDFNRVKLYSRFSRT